MNMIIDVVTVVLAGCALGIASTILWRGRRGSESLLLVVVFALLGIAAVLHVVKLSSVSNTTSATAAPATPTPGATPAPDKAKPLLTAFPLSHENHDPETDAIEAKATLGRADYEHSLGVRLCQKKTGTLTYPIHDKYTQFQALIGLTGTPSTGTVVTFKVLADTTEKFIQEVRDANNDIRIDVRDLAGFQQLKLVVTSNQAQNPCRDLTAWWADTKIIEK